MRHAAAGERDSWQGDDRLRPLDKRGSKQAAALVDQLRPVAPTGPVLSSPYVRCIETVEPLARARRVDVEEREELAEGTALHSLDLARAAPEGAVLCTHGDVMVELLGYLRRQGIVRGELRSEKGSTWVLELEGERLVGARYLPPPA